jgi:hypothetical protein
MFTVLASTLSAQATLAAVSERANAIGIAQCREMRLPKGDAE